jgi:hypothetical protein
MFTKVLGSIGLVDLCDYEPNVPFEAACPEKLEVVEKRYPRLEPADPICSAPHMRPLSVQNEPVLQDADVQSFLESLVQEFDEFVGRYGTAPNALLIHRDYDTGLQYAIKRTDLGTIPIDLVMVSLKALKGLRVIYTEERAWQLAFLDPLT